MTVYNDQVSEYITRLFARQDSVQEQVLVETPQRGLPAISIKPEEGRFLQFLVRAIGAQKAIEIGTLGGYSGIWIARGLPPGGRLITLEKEPAHAAVAQEHFTAAGVTDLVEIRTGDAHQSLSALAAEGPFDFIFVDAEKPGYPEYYRWAMHNLRLGGVMVAHNAFRKGSVVDQAEEDEHTALMRSFNRQVAEDSRAISTIFPAGDGTLLAVKIA